MNKPARGLIHYSRGVVDGIVCFTECEFWLVHQLVFKLNFSDASLLTMKYCRPLFSNNPSSRNLLSVYNKCRYIN